MNLVHASISSVSREAGHANLGATEEAAEELVQKRKHRFPGSPGQRRRRIVVKIDQTHVATIRRDRLADRRGLPRRLFKPGAART